MAPAKSAAKKSTAPAKKSTTAKKAAPAKKSPVSKKAVTKKAATAKQTAPTTRKAAAKKAAPPAKKAPAKKAAAFSEAFLTKQRKALAEERATYERQHLSLRAEAESLVADFESGDVQFDEESGEGDTLNVERERDLALSEQARRAVEEIDHAIGKFELGTYGICEVSGDPIPKERLEAIPWARERVEYKTGVLSMGLNRR